MKRNSRFTFTHDLAINDLLHAVVIAGALILSTLGLADELFSVRSERVLAVTAYALAVACSDLRIGAGTAFVGSGQSGAKTPPSGVGDYFALKSSWQLSQVFAATPN